MKTHAKSGITITMLIIVIIIMIILAGSAIKITADLNNESKLTTFASDLQDIEDSSEAYYIQNGELPTSEVVGITKGEVLANAENSTISSALSSEITENGDDLDSFYMIDLEKISVKSTYRGAGVKGDADRYYIANNSKRVYYIGGVKVSRNYYFSLTSDLSSKTNIVSNITEDTTSLSITGTTSSIKIIKNTKKFTNTVNVSIDTTLGTGETLKYLIANIDILSNQTTVPTSFDITPSYITNNSSVSAAFQTEENKVLKVQKIKNGNVIDEAAVDIKNMDIDPPYFDTATKSAIINSYNSFNTFSFSGANAAIDAGGSGLKEIRYEYLQKNTFNGVVDYYNNQTAIEDMDAIYMLTYGKKSSKEVIKLPKHVKTVAISWVDNAGNVSTPISFSITDANMLGVE